MDKVVPIARDIRSLREHVQGKKIGLVQIYGINSLKTLRPTPEELVEGRIVDLIVDEGARQLVLISDRHRIVVDLARTGAAVPLDEAKPWNSSGGGSMPTARVIFHDGTGVDFREPAKTKRITFAIHESS